MSGCGEYVTKSLDSSLHHHRQQVICHIYEIRQCAPVKVPGGPGLVAFASENSSLFFWMLKCVLRIWSCLPSHYSGTRILIVCGHWAEHPSVTRLLGPPPPPSSSVTAPREDNGRNEFVGLMFCAPLNTIIRTRPPLPRPHLVSAAAWTQSFFTIRSCVPDVSVIKT